MRQHAEHSVYDCLYVAYRVTIIMSDGTMTISSQWKHTRHSRQCCTKQVTQVPMRAASEARETKNPPRPSSGHPSSFHLTPELPLSIVLTIESHDTISGQFENRALSGIGPPTHRRMRDNLRMYDCKSPKVKELSWKDPETPQIVSLKDHEPLHWHCHRRSHMQVIIVLHFMCKF